MRKNNHHTYNLHDLTQHNGHREAQRHNNMRRYATKSRNASLDEVIPWYKLLALCCNWSQKPYERKCCFVSLSQSTDTYSNGTHHLSRSSLTLSSFTFAYLSIFLRRCGRRPKVATKARFSRTLPSVLSRCVWPCTATKYILAPPQGVSIANPLPSF
jgi:hypothetical protein